MFECRSAWQSASSDPTLPLGAAICFCTYRLFDKRRKRNPEGPYWGNSPVWGALGGTIAGLLLGGLVSISCKLVLHAILVASNVEQLMHCILCAVVLQIVWQHKQLHLRCHMIHTTAKQLDTMLSSPSHIHAVLLLPVAPNQQAFQADRFSHVCTLTFASVTASASGLCLCQLSHTG